MKTNILQAKKALLALFVMLMPLLASAQTKVEIDGIWYYLTSETQQAGVTYKGSSYEEYGGEYSGSITIPATVTYEGKEYSVTSIGGGAFYWCSSLTDINIPEGVTSIGDYAFYWCNSLTTIPIPEGVTSIGWWAFSGCSSLTDITIPEGVTSIGDYAFDGCSSLNAVHISSIEEWCEISFHGYYSNPLKEADNLYLNGELVTELVIPSSVTSIGNYAFSGYRSLTSITLPESVTSIGSDAFQGCSSLITITLPESVTSIGAAAFSECSSLMSITIPEGVTRIEGCAFYGCSSLTDINIPEGVTSIGYQAFYNCSSLTDITIPESVTSIVDYAFSDCSSLTAITIPEGMTIIGEGAFGDCSSLYKVINCSDLIIQKGSTNNGYVAYYAEVVYQGGELTTIGDFQFYTSDGIHSLVNYIGKDTGIVLPDSYNGESYNIGDWAFCGCSSLTAITIPESVTSIGDYAFDGCSSLKELTLGKGLKKIAAGAFNSCTALERVTIYATRPPSIDGTGNAFFSDATYENATLYVPKGCIDKYQVMAGWSGFYNITEIVIAVTDVVISQSSATITEIETLTLTATVTPDDATDSSVTWSSSAPSVATVDNTGKVTAIAPGSVTITATANDGSGVSASCEVTVTPASYVITFLIDGEQFYTQTLTRGSAITLPEAPTKEGYTFSGWGEVPETMPADNVTVIGSFTINSYTLTYTVDGNEYNVSTVVYGTALAPLAEPVKEGYTFSGWNEIPATMPADNVVIYGTFAVNKYLVTFKVGDEVIAANTLEYGTAIVAPEGPEKEGHTFNGWGEVAETVPAYDVTFEGSYSINSYTLTYVVDGEVVLTLPILYGGSIPSLKVPAKEGYTFSGWSEIPETMPAHDVTIEGTFTQLPSVFLTINQADNGYVKQQLTEGTVCTFAIVAAEGWKIHSVTFNGEDVTSQLTEEGTFTTPALSEDAVLNIAYEQEVPEGVENAHARAIKVCGLDNTIHISGLAEDTTVTLYTTDGAMVAQQQSSAGEAKFTVDTNQVYLVHIGDKVVKIGM